MSWRWVAAEWRRLGRGGVREGGRRTSRRVSRQRCACRARRRVRRAGREGDGARATSASYAAASSLSSMRSRWRDRTGSMSSAVNGKCVSAMVHAVRSCPCGAATERYPPPARPPGRPVSSGAGSREAFVRAITGVANRPAGQQEAESGRRPGHGSNVLHARRRAASGGLRTVFGAALPPSSRMVHPSVLHYRLLKRREKPANRPFR